MPETKWQEVAGFGKSVIDEVLGIGVEMLRRVAPQCAYCGEAAVFLCINCGRNACHSHAFINAQRPNDFRTYRAVCSACMADHFEFVRIEPGHTPVAEEWPHPERPWEVLGIAWYAREEEINTAFKKRARECHPDYGGDESEMKLVTAARDWMLRRRRGGP